MNSFTFRDRYYSIIRDIESNLIEHNFKSESDKHIAEFLLKEIRDNSQEITKTLDKLCQVLNK